MTQRIVLSALATTLLFGTPAAAAAQEDHAVDRTEIERAMAADDAVDEARRAAVRSVLDREAVQAAAGAHGIDLVRAKDAVSTLDGTALAEVAAQAERVDEALAGGDDTIVISATTLIIALLVLIIILVA